MRLASSRKANWLSTARKLNRLSQQQHWNCLGGKGEIDTHKHTRSLTVFLCWTSLKAELIPQEAVAINEVWVTVEWKRMENKRVGSKQETLMKYKGLNMSA